MTFKRNVMPSPPQYKQLRLVDYLSAYQIPEVGWGGKRKLYGEERRNRGV